MKRILTAGLSPSWQHVLELNSLQIGKVNRAVNSLWFSAGKAVNAALAIHTLGGNVRTILPAGGMSAEKMKKDFDALGLNARILPTQAETRVCTTLVDCTSGEITELVENGEAMTPAEQTAWVELFANEARNSEIVVISGSLPTGTPVAMYEKMAALVPEETPMIFDFRGEGLRMCLKYRPFVVKPNREELAETVGFRISDETQLLAACRELNAQGAQWVVISDGPNVLYAVNGAEFLRLTPPPIPEHAGKTLCPIGCGDALTGGLALAISEGKTMRDALPFAMEAAVRNLLQLTSCRF